MIEHTSIIRRETRTRSLAKGITWRIVATVTTIFIALGITGDVSDSLTIGGIEFVAKLVVYYFHERAWNKIPLGTQARLTPLA